jgi:hypothetical protein
MSGLRSSEGIQSDIVQKLSLIPLHLLRTGMSLTAPDAVPRPPVAGSRVQLWKAVSKETAFGGGEHHTNGTRVDEEDRVPTNALARGLRRTEQGR